MSLTTKPNPPSYDHDNAYWNGKFHRLHLRKDDRLGLQRCPECGHENYSMAVLTGRCAFCGWEPEANKP